MKKLISVILIISLIVISNISIFAADNSNDLTSISIRPKHDKPMPGDDSLYYDYVDLNEQFSTDNLNYTATAGYAVSNVKIEAHTNGNCKVAGNKEYDLNVGVNVIKLTVTKPDRTSKTYTITITRKQNPNDDNSITWLNIVRTQTSNASIGITPSFDPNILNYNAQVENEVSDIHISCTDINGNVISNDYILKTGENKLEIPVISKSGLKKVYTINIYREKSSDNTFSHTSIIGYDSNKNEIYTDNINYSPDTTDFIQNVSYDVSSIGIGVSHDASSKVTGEGLYDLKMGPNKIAITITAENGNVKTYSFTVNRAKPSAKLDSLQVNEYICDTDNDTYELEVNKSTTEVDIQALAVDRSSAKVTGNGTYNLKIGKNTFYITVKAVDGTTKKYTVVVNRSKYDEVEIRLYWIIEPR